MPRRVRAGARAARAPASHRRPRAGAGGAATVSRSGQGGGPRPRPLPCSSSQIRSRRDPWLRRRTRGTCTSSSSAASAASPGSGWRRLSSRPLLPCRAASLLSTAPPSLPRGAMATTSPRQLAAELQRPAACGSAAGATRGMQRGGGRPAQIQASPASMLPCSSVRGRRRARVGAAAMADARRGGARRAALGERRCGAHAGRRARATSADGERALLRSE